MKKTLHLSKIIIAMFLFSVILVTTSCQGRNHSRQSEDLAADVDYNKWGAVAARSGNTLYFMNRFSGSANYLLYADTEAHITGYLCGKPECTHSDENCNAWLGNPGSVSNLLVYDQHIYWVVPDYTDHLTRWLWRMELNGEKHERAIQMTFSLEDQEELYPSINTTLQMHHGKLVVFGQDQRMEQGEIRKYNQITTYDISSGQYESVYKSDSFPDSADYGFKAQCDGDEIWYLEYNSGLYMSEEKPFLRISRYNISGRNTEVIYDGAYPDRMTSITDIYINDDGFWFVSEKGLNTKFWQFDLKRLEPVEKYAVDYGATAWITDGLVALYSRPDEDHIRVVFVDYDGNIKSDRVFPWNEVNIKWLIMAGFDRDKLCLLFDDENVGTAFALVPTDGSNMQILWHEKR